MYKIVLTCTGVPASAGPTAASDITAEFAEHRHWHKNVRCTWDGFRLILEAENDYDPNGMALQDEFSDCLCAYIEKFDDGGEIKLESVTQIDLGSSESVSGPGRQ